MKIALFVIAALLALDTAAHVFPGRERRGGPRDGPPGEQEQRPRASTVPADPLSALEREMPSLKADLQLRREQLEAWQHFDALYAMLDEAQPRMIDRRIVLSQTEPLGQEQPPKR